MYKNFYSKPFDTQQECQAAIDSLIPPISFKDGVARATAPRPYEEHIDIVGPFRLGDVFKSDSKSPNKTRFVSEGKWYFNARTTADLQGDWIGTEPETPSIGWAE